MQTLAVQDVQDSRAKTGTCVLQLLQSLADGPLVHAGLAP